VGTAVRGVSRGIISSTFDSISGLIQFKHARVHGLLKVTKTKRSKQIIELLRPAREALHAQWKLTGSPYNHQDDSQKVWHLVTRRCR